MDKNIQIYKRRFDMNKNKIYKIFKGRVSIKWDKKTITNDGQKHKFIEADLVWTRIKFIRVEAQLTEMRRQRIGVYCFVFY